MAAQGAEAGYYNSQFQLFLNELGQAINPETRGRICSGYHDYFEALHLRDPSLALNIFKNDPLREFNKTILLDCIKRIFPKAMQSLFISTFSEDFFTPAELQVFADSFEIPVTINLGHLLIKNRVLRLPAMAWAVSEGSLADGESSSASPAASGRASPSMTGDVSQPLPVLHVHQAHRSASENTFAAFAQIGRTPSPRDIYRGPGAAAGAAPDAISNDERAQRNRLGQY